MSTLNVTLVGLTTFTLPTQFSYRIPSPRKRHAVVQTHGAIRVHVAPDIVAGDSIIAWNIRAADRVEWDALRDFYVAEGGNEITFNGYWGDVFIVKFLILDDTPVRGQNFDLSGSFQVLSATSFGTDS